MLLSAFATADHVTVSLEDLAARFQQASPPSDVAVGGDRPQRLHGEGRAQFVVNGAVELERFGI